MSASSFWFPANGSRQRVLRTRSRRIPVIAALLCVSIRIGEVAVSAQGADKRPTDDELRTLVSQLVSPNQAPEGRFRVRKFPPEYDRQAQKVVRDAYWALKGSAPRSFPFVFEHLSDEHYALTEDAGAFNKNYSVGDLCRDVIVGNLQPDVWGHKSGGSPYRTRPRQPDYIAHYGLLDLRQKEWWMTHRDKSLIDLQIEVMEWVVAEAKKQPDKYTQDDLTKWSLELENLQTTKTPRRAPTMFSK